MRRISKTTIMDTYKPRIADQMLAARLRRKGAVLIEGPKWCGKTTTAEQKAASVLYMADPMRKEQNIQAAKSMSSNSSRAIHLGLSMSGRLRPHCGIA